MPLFTLSFPLAPPPGVSRVAGRWRMEKFAILDPKFEPVYQMDETQHNGTYWINETLTISTIRDLFNYILFTHVFIVHYTGRDFKFQKSAPFLIKLPNEIQYQIIVQVKRKNNNNNNNNNNKNNNNPSIMFHARIYDFAINSGKKNRQKVRLVADRWGWASGRCGPIAPISLGNWMTSARHGLSHVTHPGSPPSAFPPFGLPGVDLGPRFPPSVSLFWLVPCINNNSHCILKSNWLSGTNQSARFHRSDLNRITTVLWR